MEVEFHIILNNRGKPQATQISVIGEANAGEWEVDGEGEWDPETNTYIRPNTNTNFTAWVDAPKRVGLMRSEPY